MHGGHKERISWINYYCVVFPYAWHYTLLIDHVPYKSIFNDSYNAIFLQSLGGSCYDISHDFFAIVFPYLMLLGLSRSNVQTYVRCNPFGSINIISCSDFDYKMLFESCNDRCKATYYIKGKIEKKDVIYLLLF
jgi:hypothetical protein